MTALLKYPANLAESSGDDINSEAGAPFMFFEMSTPTTGTVFKNDDFVEPPKVSEVDDGKLTVNATGTNKFYNMLNGLSKAEVSIALPMPYDYRVDTSISYNAAPNPSALINAVDFMSSNASMESKIKGGLLNLGVNTGPGVINKISQKLIGTNIIKNEDSASATFLRSQRMALNPRKEVLFNEIDFRNFSFNFKFAPKSAVESAHIRGIISKFRYYALPEMYGGKLFFVFPGYFGIRFMHVYKGSTKAVDNPFLPKIGTSVLKRVLVNYTPGGTGYSTLPTGDPVQLEMTLDFMEVELVDRTRVENEGY